MSEKSRIFGVPNKKTIQHGFLDNFEECDKFIKSIYPEVLIDWAQLKWQCHYFFNGDIVAISSEHNNCWMYEIFDSGGKNDNDNSASC